MLRSLHSNLVDSYRQAQVFLRTGAGAGVILFLAALAAIAIANSGLAGAYDSLMHVEIGLSAGDFELSKSFSHWVNDGLMAVFFLLVGLEIKRELLTGELSSPARAMLPAVAAAGGMVVPALIFAVLNHGDEIAMRGWAIPVATDIAFSLGVLALLGSRVPISIKVFLTAVAVIDDLGAIAIIAVFYSDDLQLHLLGYGALLLCAMAAANMLGMKSRLLYLAAGTVLWVLMLKSGIHATLAGVFTALCIPHGKAGAGTDTPLMHLEHSLHTPVTYFIMPLFAFANAGLSLQGIGIATVFTEPLPAGIMFGLLIGKPIGICGAVWLAVRTGIGQLPRGCNWPMILGVALLCGIGFTVSLFIGNLGFLSVDPSLLNTVKAGVLAGSTFAGVIGYFVMLRAIKGKDAGESD